MSPETWTLLFSPIGTATRGGKQITKLEEMNSRYGKINFIFLKINYMKKPATYGKEKDNE